MAKTPEPLFESPLIQTLMEIGTDYYAAKAVADRIERLEAVVRGFGLHEPGCAYLRKQEESFGHGHAYISPHTCDCWLSKPPEEN